MQSYIDLLRDKKLTVTPQRIELVSILSSHNHINIDELYKLLAVNFPSISLATVYKNINTMLEKDFLMEVQIPNQKNVYELLKEEHAHIYCVKCDAIMDLNLNAKALYEQAQEKSGFELSFGNFVFGGICSRCQGLV